ncbi:MAG: NADP transhydrogenase subunit alpha, partial [Woeseiaceae bacterium]|nr:FAD-dependent oxidoreductase [Gammaproteobacteria bacterium]NNK25248.1 NADP transhydrogenase subunit alpha [Woeseiaceae bacterium]
ATRYAGDYEFDHGAQFFTAHTPEFREFLQPLLTDNVVASWTAQFAQIERDEVTSLRPWNDDAPHYVGTPGMNAVGKYLARDLDIVTETPIVRIERPDNGWSLTDDKEQAFDRFDWVVLTAPAPQTAALGAAYPDLATLSGKHSMLGCYAMMLGFTTPVELPWQAALVRDADISWVSVNSSKPGRKDPFTLLVHSTNAWANAHIDDDLESVREQMLVEASKICRKDLGTADHCSVHRWRYANIARQSGPEFYVDDDSQLAACGDWFVRGRVEAAFTSANMLAQQLVEKMTG